MSRPKRKQAPIDLDFTLRRIFGKHSFRPIQREVITAALEGHDVFLQAATSFGKSLCFQLPAIIDHGITIVVSPLLALMVSNNQVAALRAANIAVATINSNTPSKDRNAILDDLRCGHPLTRLLYVTPEFCLSESFRRHMQTVYFQRELSRIAIDEAHCISEWGHDFRTAYKELIWFKKEFPDVPIMCLTATATPTVREDIISTLNLDKATLKTFTMTTSRQNLHYEIRFKSDETDHFPDFLRWLQAVHTRRSSTPARKAELAAKGERLDAISGIIYTSFRKDCESLASRLRSHNIGAAPYHAGLSAFDREDCQRKWLADERGYDIIVATTAFGMGIDKENVRFVVHWQIPKSFEGFYQEAGRAGRDGKASVHIMYYSREDRDRAAYRISRDQKPSAESQSVGRKKSFQALVEYCEHTDWCRHRLICEYFGEEGVPECDYACDWHKDKGALKKRKSEGLASEEWVSTQSERPDFYGEGYD